MLKRKSRLIIVEEDTITNNDDYSRRLCIGIRAICRKYGA